jgi:selenophosphate synthase
MGGEPIMALAVLGMPVGKISIETARQILKGPDLCRSRHYGRGRTLHRLS